MEFIKDYFKKHNFDLKLAVLTYQGVPQSLNKTEVVQDLLGAGGGSPARLRPLPAGRRRHRGLPGLRSRGKEARGAQCTAGQGLEDWLTQVLSLWILTFQRRDTGLRKTAESREKQLVTVRTISSWRHTSCFQGSQFGPGKFARQRSMLSIERCEMQRVVQVFCEPSFSESVPASLCGRNKPCQVA